MKIGRKLKSIRKEKKLSQAALATKTGISQPVLCQIENGKDCSQEQAQKIATALEVSVFDIAEEEVVVQAERTVQIGTKSDRSHLTDEEDGPTQSYPVNVPAQHAKVSVHWQKTTAIGEEWIGCRISVEMPCAVEQIESTKSRLVSQLKSEVELEIRKVLTEAFRTPDDSLKMGTAL